ncbi:MAG: hypothetical protein Fur0037_01570 [Planctomycetota bacterium]
MRVFLLRHGLAEGWSMSGRDSDRALSPEGRDALRRAAPVYARLIGQDPRILASPLRRAQETAALIAERTSGEVETGRDLLPEAPVSRAIDLLARLKAGGEATVLLVGHQPHLGQLLGALATGIQRAAVPLECGMLAGLEIDSSASMLGRLRCALGAEQAAALFR